MRKIGAGGFLDSTGKVLSAAALICGGIMCFVILWVSASYLFQETEPNAFALLYLMAGLAVVLAVAALCEALPAKSEVRFCVCLAAAAFAVRWLMVRAAPAEPVSDFNIMYSTACLLADGVNDMNPNAYFQWWAYQSGFVAWMAFWIRLFHADVFFFQMMNCLFGAASAVLVYGLARRFASERGARVAGILYMIYPDSVVLAPVLTNQHLSELLLLAALFAATGGRDRLKSRLCHGIGAGVLLALSNVIRPTAAVMVLAILVVLILAALRWRELGRAGLAALGGGMLSVVAAYYLTFHGLSWLTAATGLNQYGLTNQIPEWKFILGLNSASNGGYSAADDHFVFYSSNSLQEIQDTAKQLLRQRLSELTPGGVRELFVKKVQIMWGGFTPNEWAITQTVRDAYAARGQGELLDWALSKALRLAGGLYSAIALLMGAGCVRGSFGEHKGRDTMLLLTLTALAFFCAHLLIEIQTRYRTLLFAVCLPMAALGADWLAELFRAAGRKGKETLHDRTV